MPQLVLVEVVAVRVMQMAVVCVIDVVVVPNRKMTASLAVNVFVAIMDMLFFVHRVHPVAGPSAACCKPLRIKPATCASASE